ncbi:MAG TPA: DUF6644 family protein [Steroidobacteraceae bacterium]|nr:DUF6644 family protein [Steroidobacteraceae bacterium]
MSFAAALDVLQNSAVAHVISKSNHLVGAILQVAHIFGIVLLLASLVLATLRLLGWTLVETPVPVVAREVRRFFRIGVTLAAASGTLMFIATAKLYGVKPVFGLKMALFAAAVAVHVLLLSRVLRQENPSQGAARAAAILSLGLWIGVGFAGRMIGFV